MSLPIRVWLVQLLIALLVVCSMIVFGGQAAEEQAWSAVAASLVLLIPNAIFAWFSSDGRQSADLSARLASRPFVKGSSVNKRSPADTSQEDPKMREAQGQARRILVQQYIKMLLTAVLLVLAIIVLEPEPLGFFCALIVVQAGYLAAPIVGGK